ncbi:hypothetical protein [Paenibacillus rhizophilus]|uniref:Magnesium transporter MgtE intracellular domain-containing protein n=1 Tax=Paenibacillus rhizophilus TaxID=1850366 RepID=A0A3N9PDT3_9BACL|nr:hypothetical protein [Paenibacillus rhizophilus]RQW13467.1 hypothetical protein EH198_03335 [Paenibacillus rhizophilus]
MNKTPAAISRKKRKFKWLPLLFVLILIGGALFYRKPLAQLISTWLGGTSAGTSAVAPSSYPDTSKSTPPVESGMGTVKSTLPAANAANAASTASPSPGSANKKETYIRAAAEIAKSYAAMLPSKAAAILQTQSAEEIIYAMAEMSSIERGHIWSKMDPAKVAEVSFQLKNRSDWTNQEIAQLQKKVNFIKRAELKNSPLNEVAKTYSQMPPAEAAKLIDNLLQTDTAKTLSVVKAMDSSARTRILTVMTDDQTLIASAALIVKAIGR